MLDNGLNDGDHVDRCGSGHLCQCPALNHSKTGNLINLSFTLTQKFPFKRNLWVQLLPLRLSPEQIGPQDYGDVAGGHLINLTVLSQSGQKLHQIPATEAQIALKGILSGLVPSFWDFDPMSDACGVDKMCRQFNQSPFSVSDSSNVKD